MNRAELIKALGGPDKINGYEAASAILPHATDSLWFRKDVVYFHEEKYHEYIRFMIDVDTRINVVCITTQSNHPCYGGETCTKTRHIYHTRKGKAAFMRMVQDIPS